MKTLCLAIALTIGFVVPASSLARSQDDNACGMIANSTTFKALMGGTHMQFARNVVAHPSKQNTSGVLHSVCNGYIWRGTKPASRQAAIQALRSGSISLFAIDTWEPDDLSPYADKWLAKQFPPLVKHGAGITLLPGLPHAAQYQVQAFSPKTYGIGARGVLARPLPGVGAGGAMWWKASEGEVVFVAIGAGSGHSIPTALNRAGQLLTGAFGMLG
jgi:hypothetical protein